MSRVAKFAWAVLVGNVLVILWGAYVRATGSGAGCGSHWPTCDGEVVPHAPSVAKLIEYSHRVSSGFALVLVLGLGLWVFLTTSPGAPARRAAAYSMGFMGGEVMIGGVIVLLKKVALDPSIGHGVLAELHACNTFLLLAALTLTAHFLSGGPGLRLSGQGPTLVTLGQGFAGLALTVGTGVIAALGDTLFPAKSLGEGLAQDLSPGAHLFLHLRTLHPLFAIVAWVLLLTSTTSLRGRDDISTPARSLAGAVLVTATAQVALGGLNLWLLVPIPTQMLHLACADVLFILLVLTSAHALEESRVVSAVGGVLRSEPSPIA